MHWSILLRWSLDLHAQTYWWFLTYVHEIYFLASKSRVYVATSPCIMVYDIFARVWQKKLMHVYLSMKYFLLVCCMVWRSIAADLPTSSLWTKSPAQIVQSIQNPNTDINSSFERTISVKTKVQHTAYPLRQWVLILKDSIFPYINMLMYFGLAIATILIIRQWSQLIINKWADDTTLKNTKTRMINIAWWVLFLVGSYLLVRIFLWLLSAALWV